jgi:hypothetical protein
MAPTAIDLEALYARHREPLLLFLARRTADARSPSTCGPRPSRTPRRRAAASTAAPRRRRRAGCTGSPGAGSRCTTAAVTRNGRALDRLQLERPHADAGLIEGRMSLSFGSAATRPRVTTRIRVDAYKRIALNAGAQWHARCRPGSPRPPRRNVSG